MSSTISALTSAIFSPACHASSAVANSALTIDHPIVPHNDLWGSYGHGHQALQVSQKSDEGFDGTEPDNATSTCTVALL